MPDWDTLPDLLPANQVAAILGIERPNLRAQVHNGKISKHAHETRTPYRLLWWNKSDVRSAWEYRKAEQWKYYNDDYGRRKELSRKVARLHKQWKKAQAGADELRAEWEAAKAELEKLMSREGAK